MMRRMKRVWWFFTGGRCENCGEPVPSTELVAGRCLPCVDETRQWVASLGGVITMPQGWRWP